MLVPNKIVELQFKQYIRIYINKIIESLKSKKAPGIDGLITEIVKIIKNEIIPQLFNLINLIFVTGECPNHFKGAIILPNYKKGDGNNVFNYRPITLITTLLKFLTYV